MRYAVMVEPQRGLTYDDLLRIARTAEEAGFEALHRADHLGSFGAGPERDATEAWTTLGGLVRETTRLRLGVLVSPITFRHPALLARMAATVDRMSGGRLEVGLGAGWVEGEHRRNGLAFPPVAVRTAMLDEAATLVRRLWTGEPVTFAGEHFAVDGAQVPPTPVQRPHPPIILGGQGQARGVALAAAHANEYNYLALSPDEVKERRPLVRAACERLGRDPASLSLSVTVAVTVGDDAADRERRVAAARAETGTLMDERRSSWIAGDGDALRERVAAYERAGIDRIILQDFIPHDTEMLREVATMLGLNPL